MDAYLKAAGGGVLIGLAAVLMLGLNGKILGVSGIAGGLLEKTSPKKWRVLFLFGVLAGGLLVRFTVPGAFAIAIARSPAALVAAGLLVGYGTRLGGGCTSGHGICGVSRLSPRSLLATITFMVTGALTVFAIEHVFGGRL